MGLAIHRVRSSPKIQSLLDRRRHGVLAVAGQIDLDPELRHHGCLELGLVLAVEVEAQVPQQMEQVPIEVLRALRDVEQIVRIEKQALGQREQDLLRFHILQIARLCGENG